LKVLVTPSCPGARRCHGDAESCCAIYLIYTLPMGRDASDVSAHPSDELPAPLSSYLGTVA
ncbi:hypothetical protein, partial [Xanthomonas phaseoli]